ncbi:MAG: DUF4864 domain-containing protein [Rhodocyclaceae bacterium]|nr:DUF4864 domain-containing protein [Rhodocyclaceae bacterium]
MPVFAAPRLLLLAALLLCGAGASAGNALGGGEERDIRAVVEAQLAAFAADDGARAFSFASPSLQARFRTPERFLDMVRSAYKVVYRPASTIFLPVIVEGEVVLQRVLMTDSAGDPWLALYEMERQTDGSWRIAACTIGRRAVRSV